MHRELRAVAAAVEGFQQQEEQAAEKQQEQQQESDADASLPLPLPATTAGGALQRAVMQQRLAGLQARKQQLEESLAGLGIVSPAAGDAAGPGPSTQAAASGTAPPAAKQQPQRRPTAAAGQLPAGGGGKRKGKQKVQFELDADADVFADAEAAAGGGGGASSQAGLVETERDRLIRLVSVAAAGQPPHTRCPLSPDRCLLRRAPALG